MWHLLDTWRNKSEHWRRMFALSVAGGITLVILILWIVVFFPQTQVSSSEGAQISADEIPGPLSTLGSSFSQAFAGVKEQFNKLDGIFTTQFSATNTPPTGTETGGN